MKAHEDVAAVAKVMVSWVPSVFTPSLVSKGGVKSKSNKWNLLHIKTIGLCVLVLVDIIRDI